MGQRVSPSARRIPRAAGKRVEVRSRRHESPMKPVRVHLARDPPVALAVAPRLAGTRFAGGNFTIKTTEVTESAGEWHIKVRIDLSRAPGDDAHPDALHVLEGGGGRARHHVEGRRPGAPPHGARRAAEADPVDGRRLRRPERQGLQVDVLRVRPAARQRLLRGGRVPRGALGPRRGRRRRAEAHAQGRQPARLPRRDGLHGDPKAQQKKGPKIEAVNSGLDGGTKVASNDDVGGSAAPTRRRRRPVGNGGDMVPGSAYNKTSEEEAVKGHPNGCGCVAAGLDGAATAGLAGGAAALLGLGLALRRRRAVARASRLAHDRDAGEAVAQARKGKLLPLYVVVGEERLLRDQVVAELRAASLAGGVAAFNEDKFTAGEVDVEAVVSAARTVPMMAPRRFVLVRGAERWDAVGGGDVAVRPPRRVRRVARSTRRAWSSSASKLDGRRKLAAGRRASRASSSRATRSTRARCPSGSSTASRAKGHAVDRDVAELLAALAGPQLSSVDDAIERLSLYAGPGAADRRGRRRRVRRARADGRHLGARRRRGRARPRRARCARWPTPTTRASAGCRCSGRSPGRSASSRATRRRVDGGRLAGRGGAARGRLPAVPRARARAEGARRAGRRRSSAGCSSSPRPTWR